MRFVRPSGFLNIGNSISPHTQASDALVSSNVACDESETWSKRLGSSAGVVGLGSYRTAWTWLHKLRHAMVRPGRDRLHGVVEVDETYILAGPVLENVDEAPKERH